MAETPAESEIDIFRKFVAELTSLEQQLRLTFHTVIMLRVILIKAVNIHHTNYHYRKDAPDSPRGINLNSESIEQKTKIIWKKHHVHHIVSTKLSAFVARKIKNSDLGDKRERPSQKGTNWKVAIQSLRQLCPDWMKE